MQQLNNKKTIRAWTIYDWANSVYSLVITSTIFPVYYNQSTRAAFNGDFVKFFSFDVSNTVLYSYSISFSFLLMAFLSPILSGIADYSGFKKRFMQFFVYLGSFSCMAMYFFNGTNIEFGILCSVLASIGFGGSLVFYNSYLPEICTPDKYDKVSARGFAMGYIGSVILLIFNLIMIENPGIFGLQPGGIPARISFLTVGIWWLVFSQYTFYHLPKPLKKPKTSGNILLKGFKTLRHIWHGLKMLPKARTFLLSFFFYNMGVQTIMYMAANFGEKELKLESGTLIIAILIIQLVAIAGALLFAKISEKKGNILSISVMLLIWIFVSASVLFIFPSDKIVFLNLKLHEVQFYSVAFVVGMVMGGIQSLSRSTYSKFLPEAEDHTSYFSFYDVAEKISIVLGTFAFGLAEYLTGNMRNSVFPLMAFFMLGLVILQFAKSNKLKPLKA